MTGCDRIAGMEAFVAGALDVAQAAEARAHVAACPRCAEEVRWLRDERAVFAARAASPAVEPPPFAAVLAAAQRGRAAGWRVPPRALFGLAAAAAALALLVTRSEPDAPEATPEPPPSFACYDDPRSLVVEAAAYATDRAVATAEDRYAACLVATPITTSGACALPRDTDVTCGAPRPLEDEVFEERTRGGSLQ
jgi:Putative zinc-finger